MPHSADVKPEILADHCCWRVSPAFSGPQGSRGSEFHVWVLGSEWLLAKHGSEPGLCMGEVGMSPLSWVGMSPSLLAENLCPKTLSLWGVLCPEQGQGGAASAMHPVTPGLMPPPCQGMASLPSHGTAARPHPDEAGTISGRHFLSHKGLVADVP